MPFKVIKDLKPRIHEIKQLKSESGGDDGMVVDDEETPPLPRESDMEQKEIEEDNKKAKPKEEE